MQSYATMQSYNNAFIQSYKKTQTERLKYLNHAFFLHQPNKDTLNKIKTILKTYLKVFS